jgi:hypothetical protein
MPTDDAPAAAAPPTPGPTRARAPWHHDEHRLRRLAWIGGLVAAALVGTIVGGSLLMPGIGRIEDSVVGQAPQMETSDALTPADAVGRKAAAEARAAEARREEAEAASAGAAAVTDAATGLTAGEAAVIAAEDHWRLRAGTAWDPDPRLLWSRAVFEGADVNPWNAADLPATGATGGEVTDVQVEDSRETAVGVAVRVKVTTAPITVPTDAGTTELRVSPAHPTIALERTSKGWKVIEVRFS